MTRGPGGLLPTWEASSCISVINVVFIYFVTTTVVCHISRDLSSGFRTTFCNLHNFLALQGGTCAPASIQPQSLPILSVTGQKKAANTQESGGAGEVGQSLEEPLYRGAAGQATGAPSQVVVVLDSLRSMPYGIRGCQESIGPISKLSHRMPLHGLILTTPIFNIS